MTIGRAPVLTGLFCSMAFCSTPAIGYKTAQDSAAPVPEYPSLPALPFLPPGPGLDSITRQPAVIALDAQAPRFGMRFKADENALEELVRRVRQNDIISRDFMMGRISLKSHEGGVLLHYRKRF